MTLSRLLAAVLATLALPVTTAAAGPQAWDLRTEFRAGADHANPQPDANGTADVWRYAETPDGASHALFAQFGQQGGLDVTGWGSPSPADVDGVAAPFVGRTTASVAAVQPNEIVLFPAPGRQAAVGWRSPSAQTVTFQGYLNHGFPGGGDGVAYTVVKRPAVGVAQQLAGGQTDGANTTGVLSAAGIQVQAGDVIWFTVGAGPASNASHDLVSMSFTVTPASGGSDGGGHTGGEQPAPPADTTKPNVRILTPSSALTNDRTPQVIGCAGGEPGDASVVKLDVLSGATVVQTQIVPTTAASAFAQSACGSPAWVADVQSDLPDGAYTLRARQGDDGGNLGEATKPLVVDTTPPRVRITDPRKGRTVKTALPGFKGKAGEDAAEEVAVLIARKPSSGYLHYGSGRRSGSSWTAKIWSWNPIPNGVYYARARLADAAGNYGYSPWQRLRVDEDPPKPSNGSNFKLVGDAEVGGVLAVSSGPWSPKGKVDVDYRWERCRDGGCSTIRSDKDYSYRVSEADRGHRLRVQVTGSNASGRRTRITDPTRVVPPVPVFPRLEGARPRVEGRLKVGETVSAFSGEWRASEPVRWSYQWIQCQWEYLCHPVSGANGRTYKVRPDDAGHKLQVRIFISNAAGVNYADTGKTGAVEASAEQVRRATVRNSYRIAFGRGPLPAEEDHWARRTEDLEAMLANHRSFIRGNSAEAESVTRNAYQFVFGHDVSATQQQRFREDVAAERSEGLTYEDLVEKLARRYVRQAYEKIFFWDAALSKGPAAKVEALVRQIKGAHFAGSDWRLPGQDSGEQIWTTVAKSNPALHGAARTTYDEGAPDAARGEGCFGAIGPGCKGTPLWLSVAKQVGTFTADDGRVMSYVNIDTAVGSILHDAICRSYAGGAWCKQDLGNFLRAEGIGTGGFSKWVDKATPEWDKATFNTLVGHKWKEQYGPYPVSDTRAFLNGEAGTYSDDLRPVNRQERWTEVIPGGIFLGVGSSLMPATKWGGVEMRATTRLAAPAGTRMDWSDKDFCRSKKFRQKSLLEQLGGIFGEFSKLTLVAQYRTYGVCS